VEEFHTEILPEALPPKRPFWRQAFVDVLETIVLSLVLFLFVNAVSARIRVDSYSMEPTLYRGNFVMVNKLAYRLGTIERSDVIVFRYPPNPQEQYIKRVIGLPGDQVLIRDGKVMVNGELLAEPYLQVKTARGGEWQVPAGELFVLGDNRNNSSDSRVWGMVPLENVIGKAVLVYWPPERWGLLSFPRAAAAGP
jgi:signal peptidase I